MAELATGYVSLAISTKGMGRDIARQFAGVEKQAASSGKRAGSSFASGFKSLAGGAALIGAAAAVGSFFKGAIDGASDLSETINKSNVIFGKNAEGIRKWSQSSATALGLTQQQALDAAAGFGDMFTQLGFTSDAAAKMSKTTVGLAADLGSFNNLPTADVQERIAAAFRGEYDSLQKVIPNINAARVEQVALATTGKETAKQLTAQEKAAAVLAIVHKDGARAAGDFARTSGGLANQQKILSAQFNDIKTTVGAALVPALARAAGALNGFLNGMKEGTGAGGKFASIMRGLGAVLGPLFSGARAAISGFVGGLKTASPTLDAIKGFIGALVPTLRSLGAQILGVVVPAFRSISNLIATQLLPSFRAMLPVLLPVAKFLLKFFGGVVLEIIRGVVQAVKGIINVISGVFKLVVALVRGDWAGAWAAVKQIVMGALNAVIGIIRVALNISIIGILRRGVLSLLKSWTGLWTGMRNLATKGMNAIRSFVTSVLSGIGRVFVRSVKAYIGLWRNLFVGLRSLVTKGFTVIRSFIGSSFAAIRALFRGILTWISTTFKAGWAKLKGYITAPISAARSAISSLLGKGKNGLQAVFDHAVRGITRIWNGLKSAAKKPISFIINTVLNGGLIKAFNVLAGLLPGVDKIKPIKIEGFDRGGWTGPGAKMQPAGIVHADEFVVKKQSRRKFERKHPGHLDYLNKTGSLPGYFLGGGVRPAGGRIVPHRLPYYGARWAGDLQAGHGSPVRAYKAGQVSSVNRWNYSYGHHVRVNHGGERTLYAHMSKILVKVGQTLSEGQRLGNIGSTGNSTGPHLHFELHGGSGKLDTSSPDSAKDSVIDYLGKFRKKIAGPMNRLKELGNTPIAQAAKGAVSKIKDGLISKVKNAVPSVTGAIGKIGKAMGLGRQAARIAGLALGASSVSTYPGHQPSEHKAWDFMAKGRTGERIAQHLAKHRKKYNVSYLIWNRRILRDYNKAGAAAGTWNPYFDGNSSNPNRAHTNHVHASFYDRGGVLKPGATLSMNATRKPEAILTNPQWSAVSRLAEKVRLDDRSGSGMTVTGNVFNGLTAEDVAEALDKKRRRQLAMQPVMAGR